MSKTSQLLEENSIILAKYCYLNDEDVQDIYDLYNDLKESSHTDMPMIEDFKSWSKLPICQFTEKIFEYYNLLQFSTFFHLVVVFCACPSEFVVRYILRAFYGSIDLNNIPSKTLIEFQSLIADPDNTNLVQALVQTNFINTYGKYGNKVSDYISFLVTDIKYCFLLVLFQKQMSKSTLGVAQWKEIKSRRNTMIDYYNYIEKYKKPPKESTIKKLSRIFKREHNPYQYDYSCDINEWVSIEMELLDDCIVKYHHTISMPENPRISLLKRTGSTYTVERPFIKTSLLTNEKCVLINNITPIEKMGIKEEEEEKEYDGSIVNKYNNTTCKYPEYSPIQSRRKSSDDCEEKEEESEYNNNKYKSFLKMSEMKIDTCINEDNERMNIPLVKSNLSRPSLSDLPTPLAKHIFFSKSNSSSPKSIALKSSMSQCQIASQKISLRSKEVNLPGQVYKV